MTNRKVDQEFFRFGKTLTTNLENDFRKLLKSYSDDEVKSAEISSLVISKYSEKHRFYHNLSHVSALLMIAESFREKISDHDSVCLAIWFHDVIYQPKNSDNEIESAKLAVIKLTELNFPKSVLEKVERMILATQKHDASGMDQDGKLFLDFDLSILGTKEEIYKKYARAIKQEYSFVPDAVYRYRRKIILRRFLLNGNIYYTDEVRALFEEQARLNIENEIKELS